MKRADEQASKQVDPSFLPSDRYFSAFWVVVLDSYQFLLIFDFYNYPRTNQWNAVKIQMSQCILKQTISFQTF